MESGNQLHSLQYYPCVANQKPPNTTTDNYTCTICHTYIYIPCINLDLVIQNLEMLGYHYLLTNVDKNIYAGNHCQIRVTMHVCTMHV